MEISIFFLNTPLNGIQINARHSAPEQWPIEWDKAPKHFLQHTTIKSPHSQKFMVSRIFSIVLIFLDPLLDKFTVMEVF